jgi:hypothetical protein
MCKASGSFFGKKAPETFAPLRAAADGLGGTS